MKISGSDDDHHYQECFSQSTQKCAEELAPSSIQSEPGYPKPALSFEVGATAAPKLTMTTGNHQITQTPRFQIPLPSYIEPSRT